MPTTKEKELYLASNVDVRRGSNPDGSPRIIRIAAGQMVKPSDFTPKEFEDLKYEGAIRRPTPAELEELAEKAEAEQAAADANAEAAAIAADAEQIANTARETK